MTQKKDKNKIHIIDYKLQKIKPLDNFELSEFINEVFCNGKIEEKRYLAAPNEEAALYILDSEYRKIYNKKGNIMKKEELKTITKYFKSLTIRDLSTWIDNAYSESKAPLSFQQIAEQDPVIMKANTILRGKKKYLEAKRSAFVKKCLYG